MNFDDSGLKQSLVGVSTRVVKLSSVVVILLIHNDGTAIM